MTGCTQGNFRFSVIIIDGSVPSCNQGEPWKEHRHLWLSWERGSVGTGAVRGRESNEQGGWGLNRAVCLVANCDLGEWWHLPEFGFLGCENNIPGHLERMRFEWETLYIVGPQ